MASISESPVHMAVDSLQLIEGSRPLYNIQEQSEEVALSLATPF